MVHELAAKKTVSPKALLLALRPKQWVKNGVLLAGLVFTLDQHHPLLDWLRVAAGIVVFCALASAIYLINDISDVEQDRVHPRKRNRPIAAGRVSIPQAWTMSVILALLGLGAAAALGLPFLLTAGVYVALTVSYTFWLKHAPILDVIALAFCYVIRAVAGAVVVSVQISPWLFICTTLGALLIGLAKRRNELTTLENAGGHRKSLDGYTLPLLDQMIGVASASTLMAYMLYTVLSKTGQERPLLLLTIPFVMYGVLRFLYMIHRDNKGGDPTAEIVEDRSLMVCALLWMVTCGVAMLWRP